MLTQEFKEMLLAYQKKERVGCFYFVSIIKKKKSRNFWVNNICNVGFISKKYLILVTHVY